MRYIKLILFCLLLSSCGAYQVSTTPKVKINKVLTITNTGDTLAVPIKEFQKYNYNNFFDNHRYNFNYGFGWYNNFYPYNYGFYNYRPNNWYYRDWYYKPPIYIYSTEIPQLNKPRVYVKGRRGSENIRITPNNSNNDQTSRLNIRTPRSSESNSNGWRGRSRQVLPTQPTKPVISTPSQPRQIRRGSGSSSVQQPITRVSSGRQGSTRTIRQQD